MNKNSKQSQHKKTPRFGFVAGADVRKGQVVNMKAFTQEINSKLKEKPFPLGVYLMPSKIPTNIQMIKDVSLCWGISTNFR